MGARERWIEIRDDGVYEVSENDGPVFIRRGAERRETPLPAWEAIKSDRFLIAVLEDLRSLKIRVARLEQQK